MEDPESKETTPINTPSQNTPLLIFGRTCTLQNDTLTLRELHRLCALVLLVSAVCGTVICYQREAVGKYFNVRWLPVLATGVMSLMYSLKYVNNYMGGWGTAQGKFWCDVKIMYVRGFNTVRTVTRFINMCLLFTLVCHFLTLETSTTFVCLLMVLGEWQAGVLENQNQYDIRFQDKFVDDDDCLSLPALHAYQTSHPIEHITWSAFFTHSIIELLTLTFVFAAAHLHTDLVFAVPVIVCVIMWSFLVPAMLNFAYLKQAITFCQLEMYRMIGDLVILPITVMFTLV